MRRLRPWQRATMVGGFALLSLSLTGLALGAAGKPKMQVLPKTTGLKYSQNIEVKAQNLPKGSGTIALTICGLNDAAGKKIAKVGADDCAGADDLNSGLVKLQKWSDGTFDQKYVLPKSGQKFGKHQRFCNASHNCALVVADANPDKPAYTIVTDIRFNNQKSTTKTTTTKPKTTTTKKPKPAPTTTTTTTQPGFTFTGGAKVNGGPAGSGSGSGSVSVTVPAAATLPSSTTTPTVTVPAPVGDAVTDACAQVAKAVEQGGGDASALTVACSTLVNGGGGSQLKTVLESPSVGCFELSSATQNNEQLADACSQLATALQPYSSQLGDALSPVFGAMP